MFTPSLTLTDTPHAAKARFWDRAARKYAASPIADIEGYENTLRRVQAPNRACAHFRSTV